MNRFMLLFFAVLLVLGCEKTTEAEEVEEVVVIEE